MKKNRVERFFDELKKDCTDYEIAIGLSDGEIEVPEWLGISEDVDNIRPWDHEKGCLDQTGFFTIWHTKAWDKEKAGSGQMVFFDISYTDATPHMGDLKKRWTRAGY